MKPKSPRALYILLSLPVTGALVLAWFFFIYLQKPLIRSVQVKVDNYSGSDTLPISLHLKIYNPNHFGLAFDSLRYRIFIENELNASGAIHSARRIEAGEEGSLTLPVKLAFSPAVKKAQQRDEDSAIFAIRFQAYTHLGSWKIPLSHTVTQTLPLFKSLKPRLDSIVVKHVGLRKSDAVAAVTLKNPNQIRFHSTSISYELYSDEDVLAKGESKTNKVLEPHSSVTLQLPIEIHSGRFFTEIILFKKKNASRLYRVIFHITLRTDTGTPPQTIRLTVERHGSLQELQKAFKEESGKVKIRI